MDEENQNGDSAPSEAAPIADISAKAAEQQRWHECLRQLTVAVNQQQSMVDLARQIYSAIMPLFAADAFMISLYHREDDEIEHIFAVLDGKEVTPQRYRFRIKLADSRMEPAVRSGKPMLVDNWRLDEEHEYQVVTLGHDPPRVHTLLDVPFVAGSQVYGALHLQSYKYKAWGSEEVELAQTVAALTLGAVLHHWNLLNRSNRKSYLACLHSISRECTSGEPVEQIIVRVTETIGRFMGGVCAVLLQDDATLRLAALFHSDPVVRAMQTNFVEQNIDKIVNSEWVSTLRNDEPLLLANVESVKATGQEWLIQIGIGNVASAPILLRGQVIGQIGIARFIPARNLRDNDVRLLESAAGYLALLLAKEDLLPAG